MVSSMYSLPLYFPCGTKVDPIGVMYSLSSYHEGEEIPTIQHEDATKQLEKDQLNLIKFLDEFNERLDTHLSGLEKQEGQDKKRKDMINGKKAVNKMKEAEGKGIPLSKDVISSIPWKMVEDKVGAEEKNGISACSIPTLSRYEEERIGKISITITSNDEFWMEGLAKVGSKRGVKLSGEIKNGITKGNEEIQVMKGDSFSLSMGSFTSYDRITGWKILGILLGLFSFNHQFAVQNSHSHRWLTRLDDVIGGGMDEKNVSALLSSSSQFLSRFDSLSSHAHFSLPDILIRPLFNGNLPNNVELWAKRLDSVL